MSESAEQIALFEWAAYQQGVIPELRWMFAIPNGGFRNKATAGRLKAEGVKAGVSDVFLPAPRGTKSGLWIEMKHGDGKPTPAQREFQAAMLAAGYESYVCHGWAQARELILAYLYPVGKHSCPSPIQGGLSDA